MSEFKDYYDQAHIVYGMSKMRKDKIVRTLGVVSGLRILDIGCGVGSLGALLKTGGNYVAGIDMSKVSVESAKKVLDFADVGDVQNGPLPFKDGSFDVVILTEVIEHLLFPERALREIYRLLKPGGFMILTTPNFLVWTNRIKMMFGKFAYTETGFFDRGHVHFYTLQMLVKDLTGAGFVIAETNHIMHPKIPDFIGSMWPSLFAFQFVVKALKK